MCNLGKRDGDEDCDAPFSFLLKRGGLVEGLISQELELHVPLSSSLNMVRDIWNDHDEMECLMCYHLEMHRLRKGTSYGVCRLIGTEIKTIEHDSLFQRWI